MTKNISKH